MVVVWHFAYEWLRKQASWLCSCAVVTITSAKQAPRVLPPQGATIQEMDEAEHAHHGAYSSSQASVQEPDDPAGAPAWLRVVPGIVLQFPGRLLVPHQGSELSTHGAFNPRSLQTPLFARSLTLHVTHKEIRQRTCNATKGILESGSTRLH